jgi:hypothetical protein
MAVATCPDAAFFERVANNTLSAAEIEEFAQHLEDCPACAERLGSAPASVQLVLGLRSAVYTPVPDSPNLQALMARLEKLAAPATPDHSGTPTADLGINYTPPPGGSGGHLPDDLTSFLAPPQAPDELGRLGPYRVLKVLGAGGMGVVFRAEDPQLSRPVALKAMLPMLAAIATAKQRFLREAKAAAAVKHDHVVAVYQVGEDRDIPFLAMEFLEGEPLDDRLEREPILPIREVLRIGHEIAEGLQAAHERGLVHRDIKPANLWLEGERGRVKVLDFGLARAATGSSQLTQSGAIVGTPAYMAPEQAQGKAVDHRCDLFSLGVVMYRMTTGHQPFRGTDPISTLLAVATQEPSPPMMVNGEVPAELSDLIMKLLAKTPDARPSGARAVADELARLAGAARADRAKAMPVGPDAGPRFSQTHGVGPHKRRRAPVFLAASILIAVAVVAPVGYFLAPLVVRIAGARGDLVVEVEDKNVEVTVKQGSLVLTHTDMKKTYQLAPGDGEVIFRDLQTGVVIKAPHFKVERGKETLVTATIAEIAKTRKENHKGPAADGQADQSKKPDDGKPPTPGDEDYKAVEWVMSAGGIVVFSAGADGLKYSLRAELRFDVLESVTLSDYNEGIVQIRDIRSPKDLPARPLRVLDFRAERATDTELDRLKGLKYIKHLRLRNTTIGDNGLAHLKDLTMLVSLDLRGTRVGDAGLAHLKGLTNLEELSLADCAVSDAGLKHLHGMRKLRELDLGGTKVTAEGTAALRHVLEKCWILPGPPRK